MSVNSHIQVPNFILKNFRDKSGKVNHLDLEKLQIRACGSKDLGTEYGYYSDEIESLLNKEFENPFSKVISDIKGFLKEPQNGLLLPSDFDDVCKRYITISSSRSDLLFDAFKSESFTAFLFSEQQNHDNVVSFTMGYNGGIFPELLSYKVRLLVNNTNRTFLLPRNGFYVVSSDGKQCVAAPIMPEAAILLIPGENTEESNAETEVMTIDDSTGVWWMNRQAVWFEYVYNKSFVASTDINELEYFRCFVSNNKEKLEDMRQKVRE